MGESMLTELMTVSLPAALRAGLERYTAMHGEANGGQVGAAAYSAVFPQERPGDSPCWD